MHLGGPLADDQDIRDLSARFALGQQQRNLALSGRQAAECLPNSLTQADRSLLWQRCSRAMHKVLAQCGILDGGRQFLDEAPRRRDFLTSLVATLEMPICPPQRTVDRPQERSGIALLRATPRLLQGFDSLIGT